MNSDARNITSLVLVLVAFSSLISMFALTRIDNIIHQELYSYNLQFSYGWAVPYWTMVRLAFAMGWLNIIIAIAFQLYVLRSSRASTIEHTQKKPPKVNWRVSWKEIFDLLIRLEATKILFGIGNPYGKSLVVEVEPQKRHVSMTLHPYEKKLTLR